MGRRQVSRRLAPRVRCQSSKCSPAMRLAGIRPCDVTPQVRGLQGVPAGAAAQARSCVGRPASGLTCLPRSTAARAYDDVSWQMGASGLDRPGSQCIDRLAPGFGMNGRCRCFSLSPLCETVSWFTPIGGCWFGHCAGTIRALFKPVPSIRFGLRSCLVRALRPPAVWCGPAHRPPWLVPRTGALPHRMTRFSLRVAEMKAAISRAMN